MLPNSSGSSLLDVLPDFSEQNDQIGSITIAALVVETLADGKLDDVSDAQEEEEGIIVARASLPRPVDSPSEARESSRRPKPMSSPARLVGAAFTVVAVGFGIGFLLTRPAPPAPGGSHSTPAVAAAPSVIDAVPIVSVPKVSIPADAAAVAPIESAPPSASKAPPTLADGEWMLRHGQAPRAEAIYRSVLASGESEYAALTGLGKVALYNRQPSEALAFFERALARQPQYFPARLGRADALWDAGRHDSAKAHYAAIRERYLDGTIPARVIERTR